MYVVPKKAVSHLKQCLLLYRSKRTKNPRSLGRSSQRARRKTLRGSLCALEGVSMVDDYPQHAAANQARGRNNRFVCVQYCYSNFSSIEDVEKCQIRQIKAFF
jgi:hypothetical protein